MAIGGEMGFILGYSIFLFFFIFIIGMGAPSFIPLSARDRIEQMNVITVCGQDTDCKTDDYCNPDSQVCQSKIQSWPIIGPIYGFFLGVYNYLYIFYTLMTVSSSVRWITLLVITPFIIGMAYIVIKLVKPIGS
jgi:hypothetical protein